MIFIYVLCAACPENVFSHGEKTKALPHFKEGVTKVSENGLFSIEVVLDPAQPKTGKNKVKVYLHDAKGRDLEDAKVELEVRNKDKSGSSAPGTKTREMGQGEYIIRNVIYDSPGSYELRVKVKIDDDTDSASFDVEVK
jgi:hypothetical protein